MLAKYFTLCEIGRLTLVKFNYSNNLSHICLVMFLFVVFSGRYEGSDIIEGEDSPSDKKH